MIVSLKYEVKAQFGASGQAIHEIVGEVTVTHGDCPLRAVPKVPVEPGFRRETAQYTTDFWGHTCRFVFTDEEVLGSDTDDQQPVVVG